MGYKSSSKINVENRYLEIFSLYVFRNDKTVKISIRNFERMAIKKMIQSSLQKNMR